MKKILNILVLLLLIMISVERVYAEEIDFKIFPAIIEIESSPGEIINHQIVVRGTGAKEYQLKAYALEITDNQGHFKSSMQKVPHLDWISFEPQSFVFEENQEIRVKLKINIPYDIKLGDYYTSIALEQIPDENEVASTQVAGSLKIPLLITVTQDGYPPMEAEIKRFETKKVDFFNPITFNLEVQNPGFRKLKSFGKVEITNLLSKKIYSKELVPQNILVESSRIVLDKEGFIQGNDYISWISPNLLGAYSAKVEIYDRYYEDDNSNILVSSSEISFVYINFFVLAGVLLVGVLLLIWLPLRRRAQGDLQ
jgi:hypothetical protein